ncbi:hypothetical protein KAK07_22705 [Ideonella sp. 4Y16]|uniref:Uncharacterized protein n=1 Tax=Ideonella aquatica TaxID=2824119 RepID=A0A940YQ09_9BURK|nr:MULTISPECIES: hypothetical protein [Ideonella]MBQ0946170.1 hypothetical protein [Ideonella alba]MBQ0960406.1 hypothetical protein [Ideonella aquatica]
MNLILSCLVALSVGVAIGALWRRRAQVHAGPLSVAPSPSPGPAPESVAVPAPMAMDPPRLDTHLSLNVLNRLQMVRGDEVQVQVATESLSAYLSAVHLVELAEPGAVSVRAADAVAAHWRLTRWYHAGVTGAEVQCQIEQDTDVATAFRLMAAMREGLHKVRKKAVTAVRLNATPMADGKTWLLSMEVRGADGAVDEAESSHWRLPPG